MSYSPATQRIAVEFSEPWANALTVRAYDDCKGIYRII